MKTKVKPRPVYLKIERITKNTYLKLANSPSPGYFKGFNGLLWFITPLFTKNHPFYSTK